MSLSEEQSNEDNYRRDSFDNRVCDDLSEVLLKYLSLEDRLILECVSKQFQRTAFFSLTTLYLKICPEIVGNIESYKQLFKKWPKINKIIIYSNFLGVMKSLEFSRDLVEVIAKYCNNLTHIHIKTLISEHLVKKLIDKFGHKLISFENFRQIESFPFIKWPNIEELIIDLFKSQLSQIQFKRLKRFKVSMILNKNLESLEGIH